MRCHKLLVAGLTQPSSKNSGASFKAALANSPALKMTNIMFSSRKDPVCFSLVWHARLKIANKLDPSLLSALHSNAAAAVGLRREGKDFFPQFELRLMLP